MEKAPKSKGSKTKPVADDTMTDEINFQNVQDGISDIFGREVKDLPIPADIPRLYKGLKIEANGVPVYNENGSEERLAAVRAIFKHLVANLQDQESSSFVEESFDKIVNGEMDLPTQLEALLEPANPKLKFIKVLKLVHQKVMFPVVREMKKIGQDFQYKDVKGTWVVRIVFTKKHVTVFHEKRERAYDETSFFFDWRLALSLDLETCTKLQTKAEIVSFEFPSTTAPDFKARFLIAAAPFLAPTAEYTSIWKKPIASLAVHKDVARLAKHMQVFRNDGKQLFERKDDSAESAKEFLKTIIGLLDPALSEKLLPEAEKHIKAKGDLVTQIETFLKGVDENTRSARLLKLLAHNVVSPAVMKLRGLLYDKLPYKDVPSTYRIHITFTQEEKSKTWKSITVTHRKREQAHTDPTSVQFEWISSFTVNSSIDDIQDVDVSVVDITFGASSTPETQKFVSETLAPFRRTKTETPGSVVSSLSSQELLHAVISSLREKNLTNVTAYSASLPYSVPVVELLELYEASLDPKSTTSVVIQK